ncbi:MAG TPA: HAMP domain-containing sensor histidine kinase [Gemmatimonadales bacterium]|jgi:signal transduction histidine kinase
MQSIRFRLAVYYSLALTATMVAFGAAVYLEWTATAPRQAEIELDDRLHNEATFARTILVSSRLPSFGVGATDSTATSSIDVVRPYFDPIPDYVFVADRSGHVVYSSPSATALPEEFAMAVIALMIRRPPPFGAGDLAGSISEQPLRYDLAAVDSVQSAGAVLVAARLRVDATGVEQILRSMLLMAPLILVASGSLGYWLAGRSLVPVEVMIDELGAIHDGTSLNRRLAAPPGDDELARLGRKLNDMLGRVEQSFVALRRFTADASHELKTPLMVLRAGVERSLTHPSTPAEIVPTLDETLRQINQMSELITNLLTLAHADERGASLSLVDTDMRTFIAEAAETAEMLGELSTVSVRTEQPSHPVMLPVDPPRIRQLVMNLVTNALKYTPPNGQVLIRLTDSVDSVTVSVHDTGIGIAPGDLANVFERFWRADLARSRTGEHPGTGLGLAIARWIAEAHGGTISAQSRTGRGSIFSFTLPKSVPTPGPDSA